MIFLIPLHTRMGLSRTPATIIDNVMNAWNKNDPRVQRLQDPKNKF